MKKDETTSEPKPETTDDKTVLVAALRQVRVALSNLAAQIDALVGA